MQGRKLSAIVCVALLVSCGSEPSSEQADKDLDYRSGPNVFEENTHRCREEHDRWLMDLIARVDKALPAEAFGTAKFESVQDQMRLDGKGRELLLRFTADHKGAEGVSMFAIGPFDPRTCAVGTLKGAVGRNIYNDSNKDAFDIP